jgi:hypothetical protein
MSKTIHIVCLALEVLGDRDPGTISAEELLAAVSKALPETSAAEFTIAAEFLRRLASRLKGAGWRMNPDNTSTQTRVRAHTDARAREGT